MKHYRLIGILLLILALDYLFHSYLLIILEPEMGFREIGDYFHSDLLIPSLSTIPWQISNVLHMAEGMIIPIIGLAFLHDSRLLSKSILNLISFFCGILFFIVGVSGFAGQNLIKWLNPENLEMAMVGFATFRYTILLTAIVGMALFIFQVSLLGRSGKILPGWFTYIGHLLAIILVAFLFIIIPVPLILFLWSFIFSIIMLTKKVDRNFQE